MNWDAMSAELQAATLKAFDELIGSLEGGRLYALCLQTADDGMSIGPCANTEEGYSEKQTSESEFEEMTPEYVAYLRWAPAEWRYEMFGEAHFAAINSDLRGQAINSEGDFDRYSATLIEAMTGALANLRSASQNGLDGVTMFVTISDSDAEKVERKSAERLNPPELASAFLARFGQ